MTTTVLNYTGGEAWNSAGQWIEWEVEVPEDGYYNLTIKVDKIMQGAVCPAEAFILTEKSHLKRFRLFHLIMIMTGI